MMRYLNPRTEQGIVVRNTFTRVATFLTLDYLANVGVAWLGSTEKKLMMPQYEWPAASVYCTVAASGYRGVVSMEDKGMPRLLRFVSVMLNVSPTSIAHSCS